MITQLKSIRDDYLKKLCKYYRNHKNSIDFDQKYYYHLWDKFMSLSEVIYIFQDYPYCYNVFLSYNYVSTLTSYKEYEKVYDHYIDLMYRKIGVHFK